MIVFEIAVNGTAVCTAGTDAPEAGMTVLACALNGLVSSEAEPRLSLDVNGMADDLQMTWLHEHGLKVGDTVTIRIMDGGQPDAPRTRLLKTTLQMEREASKDPDVPRCAFCHRAHSESRKLIAGPPVFVCNECVTVCADILELDGNGRAPEGS